MLRTESVTVHYGRARAVWQVNIEAPAGQLTAIVGPNGAGKSSLLLAAYGSAKADGRVLVEGQDVSRMSPMARARAGVALVPQGRQIFPRLTVRDNLEIMCRLLRVPEARIEAEYERFPILRARSKQIAGVLSGGEQQMLAVSRALLGQPRIVLLDEMATGLAPVIVDQLMATIRELVGQGVAVVMAEPSTGVIAPSINHGYVLLRGEVVRQAAGPDLDAAYQTALGIEHGEPEITSPTTGNQPV